MSKTIDLTGQKFGRLTVIARTDNTKDGRAQWACKCECGNVVDVTGKNLRRGMTQSCGCLQKERTITANTAHGQTKSRIYGIWCDMKHRCYNPNATNYADYGGRGITICREWQDDFQAFYNWAIANGYADNLTIDRENTNGNYEPSNCRWATTKEQANNRRSNCLYTYNGKTQNLNQWAEETGIKKQTLWARLNVYHWNLEKALTKK